LVEVALGYDITNSGNLSNTATQTDISNPHLDYGPTPIDRRHVFVSNISYNFSDLKGKNAIMRTALGGWQAGAILGYGSGPSQTIFASMAVRTGRREVFKAPDTPPTRGQIAYCAICKAHTAIKSQWYNPDAFTLDNYQLGSFGNSSTGSCTGPGLANTDFSAFKNFKLTERIGMQFRLEFFKPV